jgi:hypothetical protein
MKFDVNNCSALPDTFMNIKRTSYFTFLVAITTLATVTSCNQAKAQGVERNTIAADEIFLDNTQLFNFCLEGLSQADAQSELAKMLKGKGLRAGKFKLAIDPSGTLSVYLVIDKDYKGPVSSIFEGDNHAHYGSLATLVSSKSANFTFHTFCRDERKGIASRNRILRE